MEVTLLYGMMSLHFRRHEKKHSSVKVFFNYQ